MSTRLLLGLTCAAALAAPAAAQGRVLEHEVVIDAPVQTVWELWTTAEGLQSWMAPFARVDLRPGGEIESSYDATARPGDAGNIHLPILALDPQRMLSLQGVVPDVFPEAQAEGRTLWSVTYFEPVAGGAATRLTMRGHGYGEGGDWDRMYAFFESANQQLLDSLVARFARPADEAEEVLAVLTNLGGARWVHETRRDGALVMGASFEVEAPLGRGWRVVRGWMDHGDGPFLHALSFYGVHEGHAVGWEYTHDGHLLHSTITRDDDGALRFDGVRIQPDGGRRDMDQRLVRVDDDTLDFELIGARPDGRHGVLFSVRYERAAAPRPGAGASR